MLEMRLRGLLGLALAALVLSGCSTYAASRYAMSADNVRALRTLKGQTASVGEFTAAKPGQSEITCRGVGPIKTPDGEAFELFIRKALIDELSIAETYAAGAPVVLTGRLDEIDFSSGVTDAAWRIAVSVRSSNGKTLSVVENYRFTSRWYGETACNQTAHALMPAIQNVVGKIVRDPAFPALVRP
jgi:hypothetical protein